MTLGILEGIEGQNLCPHIKLGLKFHILMSDLCFWLLDSHRSPDFFAQGQYTGQPAAQTFSFQLPKQAFWLEKVDFKMKLSFHYSSINMSHKSS